MSQRSLYRVSVIGVLGLLLAACGGDDEGSPDGVEVIVDRAPEREEPRSPRGDDRFDENGDLLESDERVAGLILPRGMSPEPSVDRQRTFSTRVSHQKVLRYVGPRLQTGEVERHGDVVIYRNAVARDARGAQVHMDVRVMPVPTGGTQLIITEYEPLPTEEVRDPEALIRRFNEELRTLD